MDCQDGENVMGSVVLRCLGILAAEHVSWSCFSTVEAYLVKQSQKEEEGVMHAW